MTTTKDDYLPRLREHVATMTRSAEEILTRAETEKRQLSEFEQLRYDAITAEATEAAKQLAELEGVATRQREAAAAAAPKTAAMLRADEPPMLTREQSFAEWANRADPYPGIEPTTTLSMTRYVRGLVTGDWSGAEAEKRLALSPATAGGHLVPTPLAAEVIDRARNISRVMQAGARTVPMTAQTLRMGNVTGDPSVGWRNELGAIGVTDMTFGVLTFTARSLACIIKGSREVFEDADGMEDVVRNAMAEVFALEIDRVALRGTGTAPEPRGVRNASGVTITSLGVNGASPTSYDFMVDAVAALEGGNYNAGAFIHNPRTERVLAKLKDSTSQPLRMPDKLVNMARLPTNQVPINLTVGTSNDCSEVYVGDWSRLLIGIRTNFEIQLLTETYATTGEYALLGWLRADVQVADGAAFHVNTGVRG
jgi:HK97 family phage major capsid protein